MYDPQTKRCSLLDGGLGHGQDRGEKAAVQQVSAPYPLEQRWQQGLEYCLNHLWNAILHQLQ